jgi:coenzyme F420-reducing hydrogenase delta subunit
VSTQKLQDQMVEKAREKGADGVVILGLEHFQSGENTNYSESTTQGKTKKGKTVTTTSGSSTTSSEESKRIRALLIKYKAPAAQP